MLLLAKAEEIQKQIKARIIRQEQLCALSPLDLYRIA